MSASTCRDCGAEWHPVRRGECAACGSDAGPVPGPTAEVVHLRAEVIRLRAEVEYLEEVVEEGSAQLADLHAELRWRS